MRNWRRGPSTYHEQAGEVRSIIGLVAFFGCVLGREADDLAELREIGQALGRDVRLERGDQVLFLVPIDAEHDGNAIDGWAHHLGRDSPYTFDIERDGGAGRYSVARMSALPPKPDIRDKPVNVR